MIDFVFAHLFRMAFVVIKNELADPIGVGLFGSNAVMLCTQDGPHLVEECGFLGGKSFVSVVAQENPHFNDSERKKW